MQTSSHTQNLPVPVTVFTGFLGSGKTTIILSLLPRVPKGYKLCLLKNEFGNIKGKVIKNFFPRTFKLYYI